VQASGAEITSAVPEPSRWLLMVLGLGWAGLAFGRRQGA
jgi:PEP-CTERM motif